MATSFSSIILCWHNLLFIILLQCTFCCAANEVERMIDNLLWALNFVIFSCLLRVVFFDHFMRFTSDNALRLLSSRQEEEKQRNMTRHKPGLASSLLSK